MSSTTPKPFFRCRVVMTPGPRGRIQLHVHRRDGTTERMLAPPGVNLSTVDLEATQAAGSDNVVIHIGNPSTA